ncbi:hypothetical protein [Photobacterium phosphoreum]|nr:hypothetical protein [Photobacterium phosphoreum]MCD9481559.1 hypothetical protein [Photobacterium phosphoreum]PSU37382.1 hypothetical protein CTM85_13730 [Photobacterium phosphoreum]
MNIYEIDSSFKDALFQEDDLGAVIRVHLHIESFVNEIIQALVPYPDELKPIRLDYFGKVNLLGALGVEPANLKVLLTLGKMRNNFAHNLNYQLDSSNVKNLYESLSLELKENLQKSHNNARNKQDFQSVEKFEKLSPKGQFVLIAVLVKIMLENLVNEVRENTL